MLVFGSKEANIYVHLDLLLTESEEVTFIRFEVYKVRFVMTSWLWQQCNEAFSVSKVTIDCFFINCFVLCEPIGQLKTLETKNICRKAGLVSN